MRKVLRRNVPLASLLIVAVYLFLLVTPVMAVDDPSGLLATERSDTEISLVWVRGADSTNTCIQMKTGSYPVNMTDGTRVYRDTGSSYLVESLTSGTTYYFRAWGETAGVNSTSYSSDMATTWAGIPDDTLYPAPDQPDNMYDVPSPDAMSDNPLYDMVNEAADNSDMSRGMFWAYLAVVSSVVLGAIGFKIGGFLGLMIGAALGLAGASAAGVLPWWMLLVYLILVIFTLMAVKRAM